MLIFHRGNKSLDKAFCAHKDELDDDVTIGDVTDIQDGTSWMVESGDKKYMAQSLIAAGCVAAGWGKGSTITNPLNGRVVATVV